MDKKIMTMAERPMSLSDLPNDILNHLVSFLDYRGALRFSREVNSWLHHALAMSAIHTQPALISRSQWIGDAQSGDVPRRAVWIPILFPTHTHSVVLTLNWNDQGWGNQKGGLFVVAFPSHTGFDRATVNSMENGEIIYETPHVAPHDQSSLRISFQYHPSKAYYLWYRVGGGGGHKLLVTDVRVHTIIHDCVGLWLSRIYTAFVTQGMTQIQSTFFADLLQAAAQSLTTQLENGQEPDRHLVSVFHSANIQVTTVSMKAVVELVMALIGIQNLLRAHRHVMTDELFRPVPAYPFLGIFQVNAE